MANTVITVTDTASEGIGALDHVKFLEQGQEDRRIDEGAEAA